MVHKKIGLIALIMSLVVCCVAQAMTCEYDPNPYISVSGQTIDWVCHVYDSSECYGVVMSDGLDPYVNLVSISPPVTYTEGVGKVDYFRSQGQYVTVHFVHDDLLGNQSYNFTVFCASLSGLDYYSGNVSPQYSDLRASPYVPLYLMNNAPEVIIIFCLLFIASIIIFNRVKGK